MVDLSAWGDSAINAWVNFNPSVTWAQRVAEGWRGMPFGEFLHRTPQRRQRALTGPLEPAQGSLWYKFQVFSGVETEQHTYEQSTSAFMSKLPLDIRLIIYEMVLGGMVFHLGSQSANSRILLNICTRPDGINEPNHQCHDLSPKRPSSAPREDYQEATGLLPLMVTCRRIYSECVDTLYSSNVFAFTQGRAAFRFLKVMIPPQRIPRIRHLRIGLRVPHHPSINSRSRRDWNDLFAFFTYETSGLQSLYLDLGLLEPVQDHIRSTLDSEDLDWIKPMVIMAIDVTRRRNCRVVVLTKGASHELEKLFKKAAREKTTASKDEILNLTCSRVHERIRLSLSERG